MVIESKETRGVAGGRRGGPTRFSISQEQRSRDAMMRERNANEGNEVRREIPDTGGAVDTPSAGSPLTRWSEMDGAAWLFMWFPRDGVILKPAGRFSSRGNFALLLREISRRISKRE